MSTMMSRMDTSGEEGDRTEWILRLLYAPGEGYPQGEISGRTRLMKGAFLTSEKLKEEFSQETDFSFKADKYGPFDKYVFKATEELESQGYIEIDDRGKYQEDVYRLTEDGKAVAEGLFEDLDSDERQLLEWIKGRHLSKPLSRLLSFVYNRYPKMAEKSELT